jgi:hypothetical protein
MLPTLDATRVCARWSPDAPDAWARPVPVRERAPRPDAPEQYRWRALLRNPQALAVTGMVAALVTVEGTAARLRRG